MKKALDVAKEEHKDIIVQKINEFKVSAAATANCRTSPTNDTTDKEKVVEDLEDCTFDELDEKFIFLDKDKESTTDNETATILADLIKLSNKPLTAVCDSLIHKLVNCPPSTKIMRDLIRTHATSKMDESFDLALHYDLNFTEVMSTHFLNLIDSPRNLMQQQQLERNTAFMTTIPILHNLFVDCNDIIDMQWVEKQAPLTGDVKWDGIAFLVKNKLVTPLFIELSSGIDFNSGHEKARSDEEKLLQQILRLLKLKKAEGSNLLTQYYIIYHGKIVMNYR
ncbi:hypothetical protein INT48_008803 [Thamnidium elegans]|uniref:Uncharacterized protein n=1 Tax=Thamnidium elegans TaxID=101142 RepID=A0A8H7SKF0_9FUNG|nr:hypothetical protein INT48_008803 [Thamnidium elegans]